MSWRVGSAVGLLFGGLACGGVTGVADRVVERAADVAAGQVERAVERSLGLPDDQVDLRREGDRWAFDVPQGSGDCALGAEAALPPGFPPVQGPLLAECRVEVACAELAGACPEGLADDLRVVAREVEGVRASAVASRRAALERSGLKVTEAPARGGTLLIATKGKRPRVVVWVGDLDELGVVEVVGVPDR